MGESIDRLLGRFEPSAKSGSSEGKFSSAWRVIKRPLKYLTFIAVVGGAGLYIGASRSSGVNESLSSIRKSYEIHSAPDYKEILQDLQDANKTFTKYGMHKKADKGLKMLCDELEKQPSYSCRRLVNL